MYTFSRTSHFWFTRACLTSRPIIKYFKDNLSLLVVLLPPIASQGLLRKARFFTRAYVINSRASNSTNEIRNLFTRVRGIDVSVFICIHSLTVQVRNNTNTTCAYLNTFSIRHTRDASRVYGTRNREDKSRLEITSC